MSHVNDFESWKCCKHRKRFTGEYSADLVTLRMAGPKSRRRQRCVRPSGGWHRVGHLLSCPDYNSHLLPRYCDNDGIYSTLDISSPPVPSLPLGYGETTIIAFFLDFRITPGGKHVQDIPDGWTAFVYTLQVPVTFLISQDLQIWTLSTCPISYLYLFHG